MSASEESPVELAKESPKKKNNNQRKRKQKQKQNAANANASPQKKAKIDPPKNLTDDPKDSSDDSSGQDSSPAAKVTSSKVPEAPEGTILYLGRDCHVRVNEFKGKTYMDFRVYWKPKNSDTLKPGNKGISLDKEQWSILKKNISVLDKAFTDASK